MLRDVARPGPPLTGALDAYPDFPRAAWSGGVAREETKPGILRRSLLDGHRLFTAQLATLLAIELLPEDTPRV
jgi:hypothetical protein